MDSTSHLGFDIPVLLCLLDEKQEELPARIRRVNTGFFQIYCPAPLRCERKLQVIYQGRCISAQVVYCQHQDSGGYHIGLEMVAGNTGTIRHELRLPVDIRATMTIAGWERVLPVRLIDMSQSGLGLMVARAIPEGSLAALELNHGTAFGEIRTCAQQSKRTYRAGFWLEEFIFRSSLAGAHGNSALANLGAAIQTARRICVPSAFAPRATDLRRACEDKAHMPRDFQSIGG